MASIKIQELPKADCKYGYTRSQLENILGSNFETFNNYMVGQTMMLCTGKEYNRELDQEVPNKCGPHGPVVYTHDLIRFLEGLPPFD